MNHKSRAFSILLLAFALFAPFAAFGHGSLVLKSTTSEKSYTTTVNADGSFTFYKVAPGTYTLSIVGPKQYFSAKASEPTPGLTVQNLQWLATGDGAPTSNVIIPTFTVTSDMLSSPYYNKEAEGMNKYSVVLYSALETSRRANLSGTISNFAKISKHND